jgi:glycine hydroxymethyltransferase
VEDRWSGFDFDLTRLVRAEEHRQRNTLQLIPSENYASRAVREATGSWLMNKYSEGYPGRRYYQGLSVIDEIERLTIDRACRVFGADHANVQPYSGSIAVIASYLAVANIGDAMLGPMLDHGGHLSHGHRVNLTSKIFNFSQYGVSKEDEHFDFDEIRTMAERSEPKVIVCGGTAFPRQIDFEQFRDVADSVGAILIADISHIAGLIAGEAHPAVFPWADVAVSTTHKTLRGPRGAFILCRDEWSDRIDRAVFPLIQGGPHQHTQAGVATALFEAGTEAFVAYAAKVCSNAKALADTLSARGVRLVSGGTDTHLILADVSSFGIEGKKAAVVLESAGVVVNANMLPFDSGTALHPSGIRLGSPSLTSRGMAEPEMAVVANLIVDVLAEPESSSVLGRVHSTVRELCDAFPVPEYYA